jgi:hypothetical protein
LRWSEGGLEGSQEIGHDVGGRAVSDGFWGMCVVVFCLDPLARQCWLEVYWREGARLIYSGYTIQIMGDTMGKRNGGGSTTRAFIYPELWVEMGFYMVGLREG